LKSAKMRDLIEGEITRILVGFKEAREGTESS
jgi:hypothetical protein